ncbi:MAG: UTRA domain-containing protein [Desulfuromusa sp.]|nr:UTRA domain-containing protein [Desulfuromusa sp.]
MTTPSQYLSELFPLSEIEHIVEAILPNSLEQDLLNISAASPCLLVNRRTWTANNLISYARLVHPGNLYRLSSRSEISSGPGLKVMSLNFSRYWSAGFR